MIIIISLLFFILLKIVIPETYTNNNNVIIINNITVIKDSKEHYNICMKYYGQRDFKPVQTMMKQIPPLISSLPGSGNSWSRLLIEYSTGYYTGSIYGDKSLIDIFPGEPFCGRRMVAIKAHPGQLWMPKINTVKAIVDLNIKSFRRRCHKGLIYGFEKIVFVTRDPWKSIWAEYSRRISSFKISSMDNKTYNAHNTTVTYENFNQKVWLQQALMQVLGEREFWNKQFNEMNDSFTSKNMAIFRYEDLVDENKRIITLQDMIKFIDANDDGIIDESRLQCAFLLSNNPIIHRKKDPNAVSIDFAYSDQRLVCQIWNELKNINAYKLLGYELKIWNNTNCDNVSLYIDELGPWIYAANSTIFDIILKLGNANFTKQCYATDQEEEGNIVLHCDPQVLPQMTI